MGNLEPFRYRLITNDQPQSWPKPPRNVSNWKSWNNSTVRVIFHESPDDIRHRYLVIFKHFWHTSLIDSRQNPHRALTWRHIRHVGVLTQYGGGHDSVPNQSCGFRHSPFWNNLRMSRSAVRTWHWIPKRKLLLIKQKTKKIKWVCFILLFPNNVEQLSYGRGKSQGRLLDTGCTY